MIEKGSAKVEEIEDETGNVLENVYIYKAGESFGSFGLLKDIPRSASVIQKIRIGPLKDI